MGGGDKKKTLPWVRLSPLKEETTWINGSLRLTYFITHHGHIAQKNSICKLFHWLMYTDKWRQCLYSYWITGWGEKHLRIIIERSFPQQRLWCLQTDKDRQSQQFYGYLYPQSPNISKCVKSLSPWWCPLFPLPLIILHSGCLVSQGSGQKKKKKKSFDWLTAPSQHKKENVKCTSTLRFTACVNGIVSEKMGRVSMLTFESD